MAAMGASLYDPGRDDGQDDRLLGRPSVGKDAVVVGEGKVPEAWSESSVFHDNGEPLAVDGRAGVSEVGEEVDGGVGDVALVDPAGAEVLVGI